MQQLNCSAKLQQAIQQNGTVKISYFSGNPNNHTRHILAVIEPDQVVYKVWRSNSWDHKIDSFYGFESLEKAGHLTVTNTGDPDAIALNHVDALEAHLAKGQLTQGMTERLVKLLTQLSPQGGDS